MAKTNEGRKHFITIGVLLIFAGLLLSYLLLPTSERQVLKESKPSPQATAGDVISQKQSFTSAQSQASNTQDRQSESPKNEEEVKVIRVIDGDTIEIEGGVKVRYIGVDTPEVVDPRTVPQCYGAEASVENRALVEGKSVKLEKDISETDKYGRLLRYVFTGDIFVNEHLVRQGFAYSSSYPPDIKYQNQFTEAQKEASTNNRGLWNACLNPSVSSQSSQPSGPSANCQIKGNISSSGEKIYHLPSQQYYNKTVIDETKGEKWICTENEAVSAGFRKSKI